MIRLIEIFNKERAEEVKYICQLFNVQKAVLLDENWEQLESKKRKTV